MSKYKRKTRDEYIILANYGEGFEEVNSEDNLKCAKRSLKEYKDNDYYAITHKLIKKRVKIDEVI